MCALLPSKYLSDNIMLIMTSAYNSTALNRTQPHRASPSLSHPHPDNRIGNKTFVRPKLKTFFGKDNTRRHTRGNTALPVARPNNRPGPSVCKIGLKERERVKMIQTLGIPGMGPSPWLFYFTKPQGSSCAELISCMNIEMFIDHQNMDY